MYLIYPSFLFRHKARERNLESSDTDFSLKIHRVMFEKFSRDLLKENVVDKTLNISSLLFKHRYEYEKCLIFLDNSADAN